jgi:hypothetical protein
MHIGVWKSLMFYKRVDKKARKKREVAGGLPKKHAKTTKKREKIWRV